MSHSVNAAQYLRMSTEHQQYSLDNQADAIARYAADHGFIIIKTYIDPAKSGLRLRNREALKQLLKDVAAGSPGFEAVLVYDVSRWGRFQDTDESAHYEYLCKSSGVPVYYCAELFANDNSLATLILKALKRGMAGEFSRELSVKVRAGVARLASMGYKAGGIPPYGLRRLLLDSSGHGKQILKSGERKSLVSDRVILIPGPRAEVRTVRRIFHEFVFDRHTMPSIARGLNRDRICYKNGGLWSASDIMRTLRNDHYAGRQVWGKRHVFLGEKVQWMPPDQWIVCENAFEPIITTELFAKAKCRFANLVYNLSEEELLEQLRSLLKAKGRLSAGIIDQATGCACATTYKMRFGSLRRAYDKLGYAPSKFASGVTYRELVRSIRNKVVADVLHYPGNQLELLNPNGRFRPLMRDCRTGAVVSVLVARRNGRMKDQKTWSLHPKKKAVGTYTALVLLSEENNAIESIYLVPEIGGRKRYLIRYTDVLRSGIELNQPGDLMNAIIKLQSQKVI
jgi:DNA invertase Pin-like site-specific DNA recombinase